MAGFGRSPFGRGPHGRSDTGYDLVQDSFPEDYFDSEIPKQFPDQKPAQNENDNLVQVLKTYANSVQKRRIQVENIGDLIDYDRAPLEIVRLFGDMLGLGIDKNDPDFLQRSFLGNASQWLQIKGSNRGYQVRGLASGFMVFVENFWRIDPMWLPFLPIPRVFVLVPNKNVDDGVYGLYHTDAFPGEYPGTPLEEIESYAKSSFLRITFEVAEPRRPGVDYNLLLDLAIDKIRDVVAIHHELYKVVLQIRIDIPAAPTVEIFQIDELGNFQANVQHIYDITPADVIPTDFDNHLTVEIFRDILNSFEVDVDASISAEFESFSYIALDLIGDIDVNLTVGDQIEIEVESQPIVIFTQAIEVSVDVLPDAELVLQESSEEFAVDVDIAIDIALDIVAGDTILEVESQPSVESFIDEDWIYNLDVNESVEYELSTEIESFVEVEASVVYDQQDVLANIDVAPNASLFVESFESSSVDASAVLSIVQNSEETINALETEVSSSISLDLFDQTEYSIDLNLTAEILQFVEMIIDVLPDAEIILELESEVVFDIQVLSSTNFLIDVSSDLDIEDIVQVEFLQFVEMTIDILPDAEFIIEAQSDAVLDVDASIDDVVIEVEDEVAINVESEPSVDMSQAVEMSIDIIPDSEFIIEAESDAVLDVDSPVGVTISVSAEVEIPVDSEPSVDMSQAVEMSIDIIPDTEFVVESNEDVQFLLNAAPNAIIESDEESEFNTSVSVQALVVLAEIEAILNVESSQSVTIDVEASATIMEVDSQPEVELISEESDENMLAQVFSAFDLTEADSENLDSHGFVTIEVEEGP